MFRDVHYVTEDYSLRIQLGYAIFRWWRPLIAKDISEGKLFLVYMLLLFQFLSQFIVN